MPLLPQARCAVSLSWDCEMIGAYADTNPIGVTHGRLDDRTLEYMLDLAALAEQADFRLQYYLLGQTLEHAPGVPRELLTGGHALDQHTYSHHPLTSDDRAEICRQITATNCLFEETLGFRPLGLRGPGGYRHGLEGLTDVQQIILDAGLTFVSTHYSTKAPTGPYDVVADKNAYMALKHLQPRRYQTGLLELPIMGYSDRHWFDNQGRDLAGWIKHLQDCLDFAYDMGGRVYLPCAHPDTCSRHDPGLQTLPALIEHARRKHEPVLFVTHRQVAEAALAM